MSNIMISFKRFITNKNTVTIIGTFLIILILFVAYNKTLANELKEISVVVASKTIEPNTKITKDMIEYKKVPRKGIPAGALLYDYLVNGKYSINNSIIPKGSFIFEESVQEEEAKKDLYKNKLNEGEFAYPFSVNVTSTYGNSLIAGEFVNIYMKAEDENGKLMIGELIKNIEIIAIKDGSGNDVYQITGKGGSPSYLYFGVEEDIYELLKAAEYLNGYSVELFPVVTSETLIAKPGETVVSNDVLKEYLQVKYQYYKSIEKEKEDEEVKDNEDQNENQQ